MPTTADTPPQGPSLEDAARAMERLLDFRQGENTQDATDQADEAPAENEGDDVASTEAEETPAQAGADKEEAADADGETEATDQQEPQMVTVTIDGKAESVPLEEALRGYQRHRDYSRKTAELANQRREVEEHSKAVREERQTYATMLTALQKQLQETQEQEPDWNQVYQTDPVGYARRRDEWRDKQEKIAAAQFELSRLQTLQQKENAETLARTVKEARDKMLALHPAWKDQTVWEKDRQQLVEYAGKVGYSSEEISQAYDPRAILLLHKARQWDELMAGKPKPVATRGPRPASAGAAPAQGQLSRLNAAQKRLASTGRLDDAAKVFEQIL